MVQCLIYHVDNYVEVSEFIRAQASGILVGVGIGSFASGY